MFYFRFFLYRLIKPFVKPMSPETAFKFHYTGLALYVIISTNAAAFAYYYSKKSYQLDDDEEELEGMEKYKKQADFYNADCKKIKRVNLNTMESEVIEFNLKEYREEQLKKKVAKLEEQKKVAML